jgi:hypothetical protein
MMESAETIGKIRHGMKNYFLTTFSKNFAQFEAVLSFYVSKIHK